MQHETFQANLEKLKMLIEDLPNVEDEQLNGLLKRYTEQNLSIINDVLDSSIKSLNSLKSAKSVNEVICTQARFTNEISNKLSLSTQRFLNASLGHISDYNEWLKAHCDLSTE